MQKFGYLAAVSYAETYECEYANGCIERLVVGRQDVAFWVEQCIKVVHKRREQLQESGVEGGVQLVSLLAGELGGACQLSQFGVLSVLYAFDENGRLALEKQERVEDIKKRGGYMNVDELKPGDYTLKVWAEGEERYTGSYVFGKPETATRADDISVLTSRINRTSRTLDHDINGLYHGLVKKADLNLEGFGVKTATVDLMKNTNVIRVVLQNTSGKQIKADDFDFYIDDDNSYLGFDNAALTRAAMADNEELPEDSIRYVPWSKYDGIVGQNRTISRAEGTTQASAVVAEMTVNRLFTGKNPQLCVLKHETGEKIFQIPLIDYVLLVKGKYNRAMSNQEYLDRQDEYSFIFFLDANNNWLSSHIFINSWRVVLNETEL